MPLHANNYTTAVDHTMLTRKPSSSSSKSFQCKTGGFLQLPGFHCNRKNCKSLTVDAFSSGMVSQQAKRKYLPKMICIRCFLLPGKRDRILPWHEILHLWNWAFSSIAWSNPNKAWALVGTLRLRRCCNLAFFFAPHCQTWMLPHHERVDMSKESKIF